MHKQKLILLIILLVTAFYTTASESIYINSKKISSSLELDYSKLKNDFAAHWLNASTLLIANADINKSYYLATHTNLEQSYVKLIPKILPNRLKQKYPHLSTFKAFEVKLHKNLIKQWLKQQLYVIDDIVKPSAISYVQTGHVIDNIYTSGTDDADEVNNYGATVYEDKITIKLWAPTARSVKLKLFEKDKHLESTQSMLENTNTGVWSIELPSNAREKFYQYQVNVFHPASKKYESIITTDPYSLSLSTNSEHSQIVDLNNKNTQPEGWTGQVIPQLSSPEDAVFYEVHIRDFSADEKQLSNELHRGKYKAFTESTSNGMKHLKALKVEGLNHIHLLPTFDIGTVNEVKNKTLDLNSSLNKICQTVTALDICLTEIDKTVTLGQLLSQFPPNSSDAQALVTQLKTHDSYNWGYDPFHYTVPEGSYAINPDGISRIVEFREMIQHLHNLGFRVIMDVVYNHTHQARLEPTAVLDKIVPNYYQRLHPISGDIEQSTCCDNTATERVMMEKLMIDSLVVWARDYKIDGFRFDLMGHQPKAAMLKARNAVRAIDADTYFYGEGWNFGEVANNRQFIQASQLALAGTEIGTFTDRLRDAVRGPGISVQGKDIRRNQGIGNGLVTRPNEINITSQVRAPDYYLLMDQLRIGLAGNLAHYPLIDRNDNYVTGKDIPYGDQPAGYALDPADTINYVSKHDNQTLWDNNQYRNAIDLTTIERVRLHNQSLSYALLAQGIPFIHMGSELLRSKSFLRDSYDYSDWFNRVDFSMQQNYYHVGLPPAEKDKANWPLISNLIEQNQGRDIPSSKHIKFAAQVFKEFLAIRTSSPLFKMTSAKQIIQRVKFLNTGSKQQQGIIAMYINDSNANNALDSQIKELLVLFNSSAQTQTFTVKNANGYTLHPIQASGVDAQTKLSVNNAGRFTVPAFTTAVFVNKRH